MKKLLLIFLLLPSIAHAYDSDESAKAYLACIVKNQKIHHYGSPGNNENPGLLGLRDCPQELADMVRYNCPNSDGEECETDAVQMISIVIKRVK